MSKKLSSCSDKVAELKTESVSFVEEDAVVVLTFRGLFLVALKFLDAVVRKVEIDPVESKSSCSFAIVSAGVVAPDISISILVSGKIRSVSNVRIFAISWSALVITLSVVLSHQASLDLSIAPSVKNLLNL